MHFQYWNHKVSKITSHAQIVPNHTVWVFYHGKPNDSELIFLADSECPQTEDLQTEFW